MRYRFGEFELDESAGELRSRGRPVAIQPKPLALLTLLVRERQRVVPADELLATLWPDTAVTSGSLTRAVSHARRAIGDTHRGSLIRSVARRGYRFCGEVVELDASARTAPGWDAPPGPARTAPGPGAGVSPFVGREPVLERMRGALESALGGSLRIVLIEGAAGIGKTRLAEVFAAEAAARGARAVRARCRQGEGVPALWMWAQVLRSLVDDPALGGHLDELAAWGRELAGLVPGLGAPEAGAPGPVEVSPEQRRFLFFDAVSRALADAGRQRPLLLVLEDLQWARPPALRLLEHLVFEAADAPLCLVATVRDAARPPGDPLAHTLAMLRQQDRCVPIVLGGFSRREVAQLLEKTLGRPAPADLISELYARTEGVPLFLRAAIRLLAERGVLEHPETLPRDGIALPAESAEFIQRALEGLGEPPRRLLAAAAVLGREFALPLAADLAEMPRPAALDALDEAAGAGVVEPMEDDPASWRFSHALFREAAYDALPAGLRARLHYAAARRLEQQHAAEPERVIAELAYHHGRGLAVGDPERAYVCALRAAERALGLHAWEEAADHYERAATALEHTEGVDPLRRLDTLLALGEAYRLSGERTRRREVLAEALATARGLERPVAFARAAIGFCDLSEWAPRDPEARRALEEALEGLRGLGPEVGAERARLTTRLAYLALHHARAKAEPVAREAVAMARAAGEPLALSEALYTLHFALAGPDDMPERAALTDELVELAPRSPSRDPSLIALIDVACDRLAEGDAEGARMRRAQARELAGTSPSPGQIWHLRVYDTGLALLEGRLGEARERAESAWLVGRRIEHPMAEGCYRVQRADLLRLQGRPQEALAQLEPSLAARSTRYWWVRALIAQLLAELGRADEAAAGLAFLDEADLAAHPRDIRVVKTVVEIAHACADLGDADRAASLAPLLESFGALHATLPVPVSYGGPACHALARLRELAGHGDEADELYAEAADAAGALGARPWQARVLLDRAALCTRRGRRGPARECLDAAARLARELGLAGLEARAHRQGEALRR